MSDAPARGAFTPPLLGDNPEPAADPLGGSIDQRVLQNATREELIASRSHWRGRALQAEPLASAALDHIERDRVADANLDDAWARCAARARQDADAINAWAARQRER